MKSQREKKPEHTVYTLIITQCAQILLNENISIVFLGFQTVG